MSGDDIVLRWPTWHEFRAFVRGVLGIRGSDEAQALHDSQARRYDDISRCC